MRIQNKHTKDIVEIPPPDQLGMSVVRFNGRVVERVVYSDENGGSITTEDGRVFTSKEWPLYLVEKLRVGWPVE